MLTLQLQVIHILIFILQVPTDKKILILGLGNDILSDDGIGPRLAHDLSKMINNDEIDFNTCCCGGLELLEYLRGYRQVVLIDAIHTDGGTPGEVYHFQPSDFRETSHLSSLHDINFITAIQLGSDLGLDITQDIHIIAVKIIEDMEFSEEFTPPIKNRYLTILDDVMREILLITH
jgi:hydrogenase maturation protease